MFNAAARLPPELATPGWQDKLDGVRILLSASRLISVHPFQLLPPEDAKWSMIEHDSGSGFGSSSASGSDDDCVAAFEANIAS